MITLGLVLAAIAVIDVAYADRRARFAPVAAGTSMLAFGGATALGMPVAAAVWFAASVAVLEVPAWTLGRTWLPARWSLTAIGVVLAARIATAELWTLEPSAAVDRWTHHSLPIVATAGAHRAVYVLGVMLFLATAGNTAVRLLLASLPGLPEASEDDERLPGGGRIIGSIERLLIFALALGGEATAAALVISAKGVLRFAEVRAAPGEEVDRITEYVLVGSLASYALAMAFVPLAVG